MGVPILTQIAVYLWVADVWGPLQHAFGLPTAGLLQQWVLVQDPVGLNQPPGVLYTLHTLILSRT